MYCKNCGNVMDPNAAICVKCGCAKGVGTAYCANCGQTVQPGAAVCTVCGCALTAAAPTVGCGKSKLVAGLLGLFLGGWGIHNFYLGNIKKGVLQIVVSLVTCGLGSLWGFIEGILILCGKINTDASGAPLAD